MPLRMHYVESVDVFVEQLEGEITMEAAQAMKEEEIASGHFGPDTAVLCVVHDVEFQFGKVRDFGAWLRDAYAGRNPRAAYLISGTKAAALMTLLQNQFRDRPVEVFSTLEAAVNWLGRDPEQCTKETLGIDLPI